LVGNTVWRIKRRSVWNTMATENAAYVCRRRQVGRRSARL